MAEVQCCRRRSCRLHLTSVEVPPVVSTILPGRGVGAEPPSDRRVDRLHAPISCQLQQAVISQLDRSQNSSSNGPWHCQRRNVLFPYLPTRPSMFVPRFMYLESSQVPHDSRPSYCFNIPAKPLPTNPRKWAANRVEEHVKRQVKKHRTQDGISATISHHRIDGDLTECKRAVNTGLDECRRVDGSLAEILEELDFSLFSSLCNPLPTLPNGDPLFRMSEQDPQLYAFYFSAND